LALLVGCCGAVIAAPMGGKSIYREGLLPSGAPLHGARESGRALDGQAAACVKCHRRSGLGGYEGTTTVPPILGRYLFRTRQTNVEDLNLPHIAGFVPNRVAYSDATLAEALRSGIAPGGRTLSYLMPRYDLDAESMQALIDYLKRLGSEPVTGVSDADLDFATIVTPDADAAVAEGMVSVVQEFFAVQNRVIAGEVRPLKSNREIMYRVSRRWRLHVWRLEGTPDTWQRQLESRLAAEPIFAVIAGIGAMLILTDSRAQGRTRYDIPGVVLATGGLVALVYGFTKCDKNHGPRIFIDVHVRGVAVAHPLAKMVYHEGFERLQLRMDGKAVALL